MAPLPKNADIVGFFLGGEVPLDSVGHLMKFLYMRGDGGLKIEPVYEKKPPRNIVDKLIEAKANGHAALPAPRKKPFGGIREFLLDLITQAPHGLTKQDIIQRAQGAGLNRNQAFTRLWELRRDHLVREKRDLYFPAKQRPKHQRVVVAKQVARASTSAKTGSLPLEGSQEDLTLKLMRDRHPNTTTLADIQALFTRHRLRAMSASVSISSLKKKKLIRHVGKATYAYIPQPTTNPQAEG